MTEQMQLESVSLFLCLSACLPIYFLLCLSTSCHNLSVTLAIHLGPTNLKKNNEIGKLFQLYNISLSLQIRLLDYYRSTMNLNHCALEWQMAAVQPRAAWASCCRTRRDCAFRGRMKVATSLDETQHTVVLKDVMMVETC